MSGSAIPLSHCLRTSQHCFRLRVDLVALVALSVWVSWICDCKLLAGERVPWTTSRVQGSPEPPKPFRLERVYPKLKFDRPVDLVCLPDSKLMLLLQVDGKVFAFQDDPNEGDQTLILDLRTRMEQFGRALAICPHPDFGQNHTVFVCYADKRKNHRHGTRLSRFTMTLDPLPQILPESEQEVLSWHSGGHNGCTIQFDNQGLMYFSAGDGADPYPPDVYDVSQNLADLRATICRIKVEPNGGYSIPRDNPFIRAFWRATRNLRIWLP